MVAQVDTITYSAAVSACEKGGRCDHACRILVEMGAAIVYKRIQDVRLVSEMATAHLKWDMDTITYIAAVSACKKGGRWDHACRIWVELGASIVCKRIQDVRLVVERATAHL
jgi:hypothetical protein